MSKIDDTVASAEKDKMEAEAHREEFLKMFLSAFTAAFTELDSDCQEELLLIGTRSDGYAETALTAWINGALKSKLRERVDFLRFLERARKEIQECNPERMAWLKKICGEYFPKEATAVMAENEHRCGLHKIQELKEAERKREEAKKKEYAKHIANEVEHLKRKPDDAV
jgi:hypothetical protein